MAETFVYDLRFHLEVDGRIRFLKKTRYYRSEDLHIKLRARPCPEGWIYRSIGLVEEGGEVNFGLGEGPRKHQRYILLASPPCESEMDRIAEKVRAIEASRGCCSPSRTSRKGVERCGPEKKRAYFNYYVWEEPDGSFGFVLSPTGRFLAVENRVRVREWRKEGGRYARARFFETLGYALLGISAFRDPGKALVPVSVPVQWEEGCGDILKGLVDFSRGVYGKRMSLLNPDRLEDQAVLYTASRIPGTPIVRIRGVLSRARETPVRISGLKGKLRIKAFQRDVYVETSEQRVIKDILHISFEVWRNKKLFSLKGTNNTVRISLVDDCFLGVTDREDAIRTAYRDCVLSMADIR